MIMRNDDRTWRVQFDSIVDVVRWLRDTPATWKGCEYSRTSAASRDWDLGVGYDGALKLAHDGWPEGVENIFADIASLPNKARPERIYDIAGDFADVPRASAGDPFSMVRRGSGHRQRPVMTIGVNTIASGGTKARVLAMYGAALVSVIDKLENKGIRVELYGMASYQLSPCNVRASWLVKGAGDAVDLSAIAFGIGHPAMMRRLSFAMVERSPARINSSYGQCGPINRDGFVDIAPDALLVEGVGTAYYMGQDKSLAEMVKVAERQLNEASVKLGGEPIAALEEDA
jgi:hypothetical protein